MSPHRDVSRQPRTAGAPRVRWWRAFPGTLAAPGGMRAWVRGLLPDCEARDDLLVVADELAANAVRHTGSGAAGGEFGVDMAWSPAFVRVVVGDGGGEGEPRVVRDAEGESQRGLALVAGLSDAWGVAGDAAGRFVWADVPRGSRGGPLLPVSAVAGEDLVAAETAVLSGWFGGAGRAGYDEGAREWWGRVTAGPGAGGVIRAPSPRALYCLAVRRGGPGAPGDGAGWPPAGRVLPGAAAMLPGSPGWN